MSMEAMTWAKDQVTGSATKKLLLIILADYSDATGFSYPSIGTLARQAELERTTVIRRLADLEEQGLIRKKERHCRRGRQASNGYFLQLPHPVEGCRAPPSPPAGGVAQRHPRGSHSATPILEPPKEPNSARAKTADLLEPVEQLPEKVPEVDATLAGQWDQGPGQSLRKTWGSRYEPTMRKVVVAAKGPSGWTLAIMGTNQRSIGFWRDRYQAEMEGAAKCRVELIPLDEWNQAKRSLAKVAA